MKRDYEKPEVEIVDFSIEETISDDGVIDGEVGGESFNFGI